MFNFIMTILAFLGFAPKDNKEKERMKKNLSNKSTIEIRGRGTVFIHRK